MALTNHYNEWAWADFVRGVGQSDTRSAMERHLSSGCARCLGIVRVLRAAAEAAQSEVTHEPPPHVVRRAQAIFPLRRPQTAVLARLIYDSFREPLPVGMRAQDRPARHALYEAANVFVELQLEDDRTAGIVSLVGQISDRQNPAFDAANLPVSLLARKGLVASAVCNQLGEFELEYKPARDLRLHVPLADAGRHVDVRLDELSAPPVRRRPAGRKKRRNRRANRP